MKNSQPFALIVNQLCGGANNMTLEKAIGEFADDSFDALGNPRFLILEKDGIKYLIDWNMGENLNDLSALLGLSDIVKKKSNAKIGLKNKGFLASICYLLPNKLYSASRGEKGTFNELMWDSKKHIDCIKKTSEDNYRDPSLKPSKFIETTSRRTKEFSAILQNGIDLLTNKLNTKLKTNQKDILNKCLSELISIATDDITKAAPQYVCNVLSFDSLNVHYSTIEKMFSQQIKNYNLYYYNLLKAKLYNVVYIDSEEIIILDDTSAIDYISDSIDNINIDCEIREANYNTYMKCVFTMLKSEEIREFYIVVYNNKKNSKTKSEIENKVEIFNKTPSNYESFDIKSTFTFEISFMNRIEEQTFKKQLINCFELIEDARGLAIEYNHRILGRPFWMGGAKKHQWTSSRNAGGIHAKISIEKDQNLVENYFGIQGDKSEINPNESHDIIKELLRATIGNIVRKLTTSTAKTKDKIEVSDDWKPSDWNMDTMYSLFTTNKLPEKSSKKTTKKNTIVNYTNSVKPAEKPAEKPAVKVDEKPAVKVTEKATVKVTEKPLVKVVEKPIVKVDEKSVVKVTENVAINHIISNTIESNESNSKIELIVMKNGKIEKYKSNNLDDITFESLIKNLISLGFIKDN